MKLEAVNGNLMSLTVKSQTQQKAELQELDSLMDEEGVEDTNEIEEQHHEEVDKEVGGKKKGVRKKRSLNWEEAERGLLLEVIKPKVIFVENRNVDAKSIKAKRLAWMQITKQFNALNFRHRSLEQIQVQWRSMKNSAKREHQQKYPKSAAVEGMDLVEFMEEMQKDPVSARSQTRGVTLKKELLEIDDEDTPLAALPTSTNTSEDTLQSSTIALPSPPPSADSQNDTQHATPTRNRKKTVQNNTTQKQQQQQQQQASSAATNSKPKRKRSQNSTQSDTATNNAASAATNASDINTTGQTTQLPLIDETLATHGAEDKFKKQIFELIKRARLADMDYSRREHEQKLRYEQMELELKLNYYRQHEELKLRQLREEHEARMRHCQREHEARMRTYTNCKLPNAKTTKIENKEENTLN